ncbi:hypothetical protein AKL17_3330 [Frigidibacter mobilis]|uniref:Uncharacterized protein n=1 Tax=Frigidibacter mobilis TaxID=1335048 RepID=A0A159Z5L6_9RHOB|nr:hypothetical protein AKL17_3330 [Frigidibacter mobilis]
MGTISAKSIQLWNVAANAPDPHIVFVEIKCGIKIGQGIRAENQIVLYDNYSIMHLTHMSNPEDSEVFSPIFTGLLWMTISG